MHTKTPTKDVFQIVHGPDRCLRPGVVRKKPLNPDFNAAVTGQVIDCCTREIVSWNLSHRCRTEEALDAVEQAVLARLPEGSRDTSVTLTTDTKMSQRLRHIYSRKQRTSHLQRDNKSPNADRSQCLIIGATARCRMSFAASMWRSAGSICSRQSVNTILRVW
jgi:transposase InsO family protein